MECAKFKNCVFFGIGETNSPGFIWAVTTGVTDTPFVSAFLSDCKKMSIIFYSWQYSSP